MKDTNQETVIDSSIEKSMIDEKTRKGWEHYTRHNKRTPSSKQASKKQDTDKGLVKHII